MPEWLNLTERADVLASVSEVRRQLELARHDPRAWKWGVIAMASAINSALVCNLSSTMNVGALSDEGKKSNLKQTIAALQHGSEEQQPPDPHLASPKELLKRATTNTDERIERAGRPLNLLQNVKDTFANLVGYRNEFLHFKPMSWSIETSGFPRMFLDCLVIVEEVVDDGWSFRHAELCELQEVRSELTAIRRDLTAMLQA